MKTPEEKVNFLTQMTIITFTHSIGIIIVIILLFLTTFFLRLCLSFLTALQNIDGFSSLETRSCPGLPSSLGDTCHMVRHSFFMTVSMSRNHNQPDHLKTIFYITCHIILLQRPLWNLGILFFGIQSSSMFLTSMSGQCGFLL